MALKILCHSIMFTPPPAHSARSSAENDKPKTQAPDPHILNIAFPYWGGCVSCLESNFLQLLSRHCQHSSRVAAIGISEDLPWLLNLTMRSYLYFCRALVLGRCTMAAKLNHQQLFLLLQSTGVQ